VGRAGAGLVRRAHGPPSARSDFADFVQATVDIAGELYGNGGKVQRIIAEAWSDVGLFVLHVGCDSKHIPIKKPRQRPTAVIAARTLPSRRRPAR
jgi:hypothetical protein